MENRNKTLKKIVFSAVMIAIGTVLSLFKFEGIWAFGGGVTFCSMLPLVMVSNIYGIKWGTFTAFVYGVLQAMLGADNVQYASSFSMAMGIVLIDYILAYSVIGLSGMFKNSIKTRGIAIVMGICFTFTIRFLCHFVSGWFIWDRLFPNELGYASALYSLFYNGSYMLPEALITSAISIILLKNNPYFF